VDVQKKDGSRTLLVPNIKDAQALDFAAFLKAFDDLVARSRKGTISPDDFMARPSPSRTRARRDDLVRPRLMPARASSLRPGRSTTRPSTSRWPRARWGFSASAR